MVFELLFMQRGRNGALDGGSMQNGVRTLIYAAGKKQCFESACRCNLLDLVSYGLCCKKQTITSNFQL